MKWLYLVMGLFFSNSIHLGYSGQWLEFFCALSSCLFMWIAGFMFYHDIIETREERNRQARFIELVGKKYEKEVRREEAEAANQSQADRINKLFDEMDEAAEKALQESYERRN
jgi:hypothetical protein